MNVINAHSLDNGPRSLVVLGLESSCDETAAGIVRLENGRASVLANEIFSQIADHAPFGGVVPEIAARAHVSAMDHIISAAMKKAEMGFADIDAIAVTAGPGLIGGVMVGLMSAKALAVATGKPLVGVNHLEGHALSARLEADVAFPFLLLLVSGGHCQLLWVEDIGAITRLGTTIDDAVGEAFDKSAKILGLGYPGGPQIEKAAKEGDPSAFELPKPLAHDRDRWLDFSFAGLKTAMLRHGQLAAAENLDGTGILSGKARADLCASFQAAVTQSLVLKTSRAFELVVEKYGLAAGNRRFVVAGGVAANQTIGQGLKKVASKYGFDFFAPSLAYCGDNGAMIALAGAERLARGLTSNLDLMARPRWPLDEASAQANPTHVTGKKGAKS